ncbi:MAG: terC [Firmicutes bacterium]|nr:terC [Bacillota bacterium]
MAIDLGLVNRKSHAVTTKEAAIWTAVWVGLALLFNSGIYLLLGKTPALEFITGYVIEYSLSVDNIFVFIVLFSYFKVDPRYRHRVLIWGIVGALVLRAILIGAGAALIHQFHWILYIFGAFLVFTAIKMAISEDDEDPHPDRNPVVVWFKKFFPVTGNYHGEHFFVKPEYAVRWLATPLFIVLLIVETTDIMFALDSIPAIFAITTNTFIVFTSNIFAILGLRSLYFLLDGVMGLFRFLKYGLTLVLGFIGVKMLVSDLYPVPIGLSLGIVLGILAGSMLLSVFIPERHKPDERHEPAAGQHK